MAVFTSRARLRSAVVIAIASLAPVQAIAQDDEARIYDLTELPRAIVDLGGKLGCSLDEAVPAWGAQAISWDEGVTLFITPCHNGDINIESFIALAFDGDDQPELIRLQAKPGEEMPTRDTLVNPAYNIDQDAFTVTEYAGPDGDCGRFERHTFDVDANAFVLSEIRSKPACDGQHVEPDQWPVEWTASE